MTLEEFIETFEQALKKQSDGEFSVRELFDPGVWATIPEARRRGWGKVIYNTCCRGKFNQLGDFLLKPIPNTIPQKYQKISSPIPLANMASAAGILLAAATLEQTIQHLGILMGWSKPDTEPVMP